LISRTIPAWKSSALMLRGNNRFIVNAAAVDDHHGFLMPLQPITVAVPNAIGT
jgi:hypothetical protein